MPCENCSRQHVNAWEFMGSHPILTFFLAAIICSALSDVLVALANKI
jgi:hypothetical protein